MANYRYNSLTFDVEHTSEATNSKWEFKLNSEFEIINTWLNGEAIDLTPKREHKVYRYLAKHYPLGAMLSERRYELAELLTDH